MTGTSYSKISVIIVCITSLSCHQILARSHLDIIKTESSHANVVRSKKKAEELLKRYGYLKCDSLSDKGASLLLKAAIDLIGMDIIDSPQMGCSSGQLQSAVKQFQSTYNMKSTGILDNDTLKVMSEARCGNSDDSKADDILQLLQHSQKQVLSRGRRSRKRLEPMDEAPKVFNKYVVTMIQRRRKQLFREYLKQVKREDNGLIRGKQRIKRSAMRRARKFQKVLKWRLTPSGYSNQLTVMSQRAALALAFRMWAEVVPVLFIEDQWSPVDIVITFGKGKHFNCPNQFDGFGGQLGHAVSFKSSRHSQIHIDDDEHYTIGQSSGTNLIKVAVHEIGHILGLLHTSHTNSIMYAIYSKQAHYHNFELSQQDRYKVQDIYGVCDGSFDVIFDWIKKLPIGTTIYNTYVFRKDRYWLYQNKHNRTRFGDPYVISNSWKGLPNNIDCFAHVWTNTKNKAYFFKGQYYWIFDAKTNRVKKGFPRRIADDFRVPKSMKKITGPRRIDAAFFNQHDNLLYFFRYDMIYAYELSKGRRGRLVPSFPRKIKSMFNSNMSNKKWLPLPAKLDSIYYSYADNTVYFLKSTKYWKLVGSSHFERNAQNVVEGPWKINTRWKDICDVDA